MPWRLPHRSVSLSHFTAPCQQLFFVFVNFCRRSGKVVFLSAACEATQSSTHCQQLFSTFRFFSSTRRVVVVARCEPSQNHSRCQQLFCGLRKKSLRDPFVRPSSTALAVPLSKPAPSGPCGVRPAREAFMDPFAPKVKAFFLFFEKIIFSALFQKVKRRFF